MPRMRECACHCGGITANTWLPGHAMRYVSQRRREALAGDRRAFQEMYSNGWKLDSAPPMYAFGVEAEFMGIADDTAINALSQAGLPAQADGYHHRRVPHWRVTEDASVNGEGLELVSPILNIRDTDTVTSARKAVDALRIAGASVDRSCGLHVHHNTKGKTVKDIAEAVATWCMFQPVINRVIPGSRHMGEYSLGMNNPAQWYSRIVNGASTLTELGRLANNWNRYHAINLQALLAHGTVEYRQHSGTLNPNKVEHWARFTRAIQDAGRLGPWTTLTDLHGSVEAVGRMTVEQMCQYLRVPKATKLFMLDREANLNPDADTQYDDEENDTQYQDNYDDSDLPSESWCDSCQEYHEDEY